MKKIFYSVLFFSFVTDVTAQNVGIGTLSPNASAVLHIASNNKGVLFPGVYLAASVDNNTIPSPAQNLIVFNVNPNISGGKGLFYNSGTAVSANWTKVGDLSFPYSGGTSTPSYAFNIQNYHAGTSSIGIEGFCQNGYGIYGASAAGTGVFATSTTGNALEVSGKIKIAGAGQSAAQGKVLTSDANGNATWQGAVAFSSTGIQPDGAAAFSSEVQKKIAFYTEDYDYGNNYNNSAVSPYSTFTAPVNGIYHFDIKAAWSFTTEDVGASQMQLKALYNGVTKILSVDVTNFMYNHNINTIDIDVSLQAGTQIFVVLDQNTGTTLTLDTEWGNVLSHFTGRLVMKL